MIKWKLFELKYVQALLPHRRITVDVVVRSCWMWRRAFGGGCGGRGGESQGIFEL